MWDSPPLLCCGRPDILSHFWGGDFDDSKSLMPLDVEEWVCSGEELESLPLMQTTWPSLDIEFLRVLSKAVEDLSLAWSALEEPYHGLLDKWYLERCHQRSSHHWPAPFLPAAHEELTRIWCAPYSAHVNTSTSTWFGHLLKNLSPGFSRSQTPERSLMRRLFKMITLNQILTQICPEDTPSLLSWTSLGKRTSLLAGGSNVIFLFLFVFGSFSVHLCDVTGSHVS